MQALRRCTAWPNVLLRKLRCFGTAEVGGIVLTDDLAEDSWFIRGTDQAMIETLPGEAQAVWIDSEQMQCGGLHIPDTDRVFRDVVSDVVGRTQ